MGKPVSIRLNPFEEEYLNKNNIEFSDFMHDSFYYHMKKTHLHRFKRIQYEIFLVLLGMILVALAYTSFNLVLYSSFILVGAFNIVLGSLTLFWEVRNGRKR